MAPQAPPTIILGTHQIGDSTQWPGIIHFDQDEDVRLLLDTFYDRGYKILDTATAYPGSEDRLGRAGAASRFTIHTKVKSDQPGDHEPANIKKSIEESLSALRTSSVDTMFLHIPDRQTPFEDTANAMNEAFQQGKFRKLGISNFSPEEVQRYIDICEQKGYVKPSVYQGHYNLVVRRGETELFPLLRKNGMAFTAYSPAAGGILSGHADTSKRWKNDNFIGGIYTTLYASSSVSTAVESVRALTEKHGINSHAAALRWTAFHSKLDGKYGDALIIGQSKIEQLHKTLDAIDEGPLPEDLVESINAVYDSIGDGEPPFHM